MSYLDRLKARIGDKPQRAELTELTKGASVSFVSSRGKAFCRNLPREDALPEAIRDAIEERAAMAAASVPACYLGAWARLQCQRPLSALESDWRRAIDDAGLFFHAYGDEAAALQWTPGDLFDVPRESLPGGLVWQMKGERVAALGADHARLGDERIIVRRKCPAL